MGKLEYRTSADPALVEKMNVIWKCATEQGISPVLIVARLPNGETVDISDPEICGKCIGLFLEKVAGVYAGLNPVHADDASEAKHVGFSDN